MKKLETFFMILHTGLKNRIYDVIVRYPSSVRSGSYLEVTPLTTNIDYMMFVNDILKIHASWVYLQITTISGRSVMQFQYDFKTEDIIFEYAENDYYSSIGFSATSEVDFFNNIGYFENDVDG